MTFIDSAGIYQARVIGVMESLLSLLEKFKLNLGQEAIIDTIKNFPILKWTQSIVGNAAGILSTTFLVFIFLLFLLLGEKDDREKTGIWIQIDPQNQTLFSYKINHICIYRNSSWIYFKVFRT